MKEIEKSREEEEDKALRQPPAEKMLRYIKHGLISQQTAWELLIAGWGQLPEDSSEVVKWAEAHLRNIR